MKYSIPALAILFCLICPAFADFSFFDTPVTPAPTVQAAPATPETTAVSTPVTSVGSASAVATSSATSLTPAPAVATAVSTSTAAATAETQQQPVVVPVVVKKYPVASVDMINEYSKSHKKLSKDMLMGLLAGKVKMGMDTDAVKLIYGDPYRSLDRMDSKDRPVSVLIFNIGPGDNCTIVGVKNGKVVAFDTNCSAKDADSMVEQLIK